MLESRILLVHHSARRGSVLNVPASGTRSAADAAQAEFAAIVGESRVTADSAACEGFTVDGKVPSCVVYPASAEEVAAVLQCAAAHELAVLPCRNLTKIGIGHPPRRYDVALSLKEMNRVWYYEPADLVISVEPGMKLGDFQHFVGRHRLWLPLDPAGGARASLGGILAASSSGPLRSAYGTPRDMVLGMKIATTEGKVIKTGGRVVKNVTGYDMAKLLIGSYGTMGVIVEASFKLYPLPAARATFVLRLSTLDGACELRRRIQRSPLQPQRLVLLDAEASKLVRSGSPLAPAANTEISLWEVWVEAAGSARVIERYARELEELGRAVGAPAEREPAESAWARVADFRTWLSAAYPGLVVLKAVLPISATEQFLGQVEQQAEGLRRASLSQIGVGIVCVCVLEEPGAPSIRPLVERLRAAATSLGGALVVECCPAELKAEIDVWGPPGDDFEIMRKLKHAWDPKGILSPGRFVGGL